MENLIRQYAIVIDKDEKGNEYFLHVPCNRKSYNVNDIRFKYCAVCHTFPKDEERNYLLKKTMRAAERHFAKKQ